LCSNTDKHVLKMEGSILSCFRYGCPYFEMLNSLLSSGLWEKAWEGGNASVHLFSLTIKTHMMWRRQSNPLPTYNRYIVQL
jgi:hypothetical protein